MKRYLDFQLSELLKPLRAGFALGVASFALNWSCSQLFPLDKATLMIIGAASLGISMLVTFRYILSDKERLFLKTRFVDIKARLLPDRAFSQ